MEAIVKAMGVRLVEVCREWSGGKRIQMKHIHMAMPGEVRVSVRLFFVTDCLPGRPGAC